ncbi:hypothetical protein [Sinorhizobium fredii]|uniref:Uncharacterized protein n=1 Tax=Rhizobium fredii TaxID=380 RepID=A0A2L0H530_RHIFR|nr:hypothetical protein [Sinorhizobium fredii]AUX76302.1 hypothetical protein NXT3_CH01730 [Sinorhizobium fredii]
MSKDIPPELAEHLGKFLRHCVVDEGFACPLYVTAAACNGSAYITAYWPGEGGLKPQVVASRIEDNGFKLPIALVVVGANAEAAYMQIEQSEPLMMLN